MNQIINKTTTEYDIKKMGKAIMEDIKSIFKNNPYMRDLFKALGHEKPEENILPFLPIILDNPPVGEYKKSLTEALRSFGEETINYSIENMFNNINTVNGEYPEAGIFDKQYDWLELYAGNPEFIAKYCEKNNINIPYRILVDTDYKGNCVNPDKHELCKSSATDFLENDSLENFSLINIHHPVDADFIEVLEDAVQEKGNIKDTGVVILITIDKHLIEKKLEYLKNIGYKFIDKNTIYKYVKHTK